jgi:hypothetical protein
VRPSGRGETPLYNLELSQMDVYRTLTYPSTRTLTGNSLDANKGLDGAGEFPYRLLEECWTCQASGCGLYAAYAVLYAVKTIGNITAGVRIPGGGLYRLAYSLATGASLPNSWRAIIGSTDGSFKPISLDVLTDSDGFDPTYRELLFNVPSGTTAITLTFQFLQAFQYGVLVLTRL